MSKNSGCGCNDYSLLTANTGIAQVDTANAFVNGNGTIATVLTAAAKGTIVRSVIIKAIQPVTMGMVRLFVQGSGETSLYKEIPVTVTPALNATPTPAPILPMFEVDLDGGLKLESGYLLLATTLTGQTFNIVAEGLDWVYPATLPDTCCNFKQEEALNGIKTISTANTNLDGSGVTTIYTAPPAPSNGVCIKSVTIKALQGTNEGMVRLYVGATTGTYRLIKEIYIPQTNPGAFDPFFKQVVDIDFNLQAGYVLGATTQLSEGFALTVEAVEWSYPI